MNAFRIYISYTALFFALTVLSGCAELELPIMTEDQAKKREAMETLPKQLDEFEKKLATLEFALKNETSRLRKDVEKALGEGRARQDVEEIKRALSSLDAEVKKTKADAGSSIDKLREEFSFVQGSVETSDHERTELKEAVRSLRESLGRISERLSAIENSIKETEKRVETLGGSLEARERNLAILQQSLETTEKRASSMEGRLSAVEKASIVPVPAPAPRKEEPKEARDLYLEGQQQLRDKDFTKAIDSFQRFLSSYPDHELADNAQYWLGEIYYDRGDWERAILEFNKVIKNYPKGEKVAASLLKQGFSFEKLGAMKEAKVLLEQVVEKFPKSQEAETARKRLEGMK